MIEMFKPFDPKTDYEAVKKWWGMWDQPIPSVDLLPKHGFIVEDLAAAFLYLTDSGVALIENVITNPKTDKEERSEAIDWVVVACLKKAKELGFSLVVGYTSVESIAERAQRLGFSVGSKPQTLLARNITWDL